MYRLIASSISIALISLLVSSCGSSGDNTKTGQVTKAQFVQQVSDVCAKTKSRLKIKAQVWEAAHKGKEPALDAALEQVIGPLLQRQAAALRHLNPPEQLEEDVARMITNLSEGATRIIDGGKNAVGFRRFQDEAEMLGTKACNI